MDVEQVAKIAQKIWNLIEEYGPDIESMISDAIVSLRPVEYVTHCGICKRECPVYVIKVGDKRFFRGKCPKHGFRRDDA